MARNNTLSIPPDFERWPLQLKMRNIAYQISPELPAYRRIRELLIEAADELDLLTGATPQVWIRP